jgi:ubiquinone/menaquinone biosynthesis C-methylase UbiE
MRRDDTDKNAAAYYSAFSQRYDAERRKGYFGFINDLEFEMIEPIAIGKRTLEIGCGTGLILERAHRIAREAWGVDLSEGMIEQCVRKGLRAQLANATALPFRDNSFDLVYSFKVLGHVPDVTQALKEMTRVLCPGGHAVVEFYNPCSFKAIGDRIRRLKLSREPVFLRHDRLKDVRSYLPEGMEIIRIRGVRIFGLFAACYTAPGIGLITRRLDRAYCEGPLSRFGGYFAIEMVRDSA